MEAPDIPARLVRHVPRAVPAPAPPNAPETGAVVGVGPTPLGHSAPDTAAQVRLAHHITVAANLAGLDPARIGWCRDERGQTTAWPAGEDVPPVTEMSDVLDFAVPGAPRIVDAWFEGRRLCLRLEAARGAAAGIVGALQIGDQRGPAPDALAETPAGPLAFLDLPLASPFPPVLLVLKRSDGALRSSALLPFPSLCRGGLHHGEALSGPGTTAGLSGLRERSAALLATTRGGVPSPNVGWIDVDLAGATGAEPLFAADLQDWLADVLGIGTRPRHAVGPGDDRGRSWLAASVVRTPARRPRSGRVLHLPADSVPSLHALFDTGIPEGPGTMIVCRRADATPEWVVTPPDPSPPSAAADLAFEPFPLLSGPPEPAPAKASEGRAALSLRFTGARPRQAAELQAPVPLDRPVAASPAAFSSEPIASGVVLRANPDWPLTEAMLDALATQAHVAWGAVRLIVDPDQAVPGREALERRFPGAGDVTVLDPGAPVSAAFNRAAATVDADHLLILGDDILLHDPRTVATLAGLLEDYVFASASCMILASGNRAATLEAAGLGCYALSLPIPRDYSEIALPATLARLPASTWPVPRNGTSLFLVRMAAWQAMGGFAAVAGEPDTLTTPFWTGAGAAGRRHVATTMLSATLVSPRMQQAALPEPATSSLGMSARRIVA